MTIKEIQKSAKQVSWWTLLKSLPYEGGPSSTRFVYMATAFCVIMSANFLVAIVGWVYVFSKGQNCNAVMAGLIGTLMSSVVVLSANAQNKRHDMQAKIACAQPPAKEDDGSEEGK